MKRLSLCLIFVLCIFAGDTVYSCTIVMAAKDGKVLAGNNEDWRNPNTKVWFIPAAKGEYGRICLGFDDGYAQGGMNDQGVFIDINALSPTGWQPAAGKPYFRGDIVDNILAECATVKDAITFFKKYNVPGLARWRAPIADKTGASVVIEWAKGRVQFVRKTGVYQVSTNFVITNFDEGAYPCSRYHIADKMFKKAKEISIDLIRAILSATHSEGRYPTLYSNICDLKRGEIYIYNFHHFEEVVTFNLAEELKKGKKTYDLPSLFSIKTHAAIVFEKQK